MAVLTLTDEGDAWRIGLVNGTRLVFPARLVPSDSEDELLKALLALADEARRHGSAPGGLAMALRPGDTGLGVAARVGARLDLPTAIVRRIDAFCEGERSGGTLDGARHFLGLDTDVPEAALVLDGHPRAGVNGMAGGIAHLGLDRTGPVLCRCGRHGCLGALLKAGQDAPPPPRPAWCRPARTHALGWVAVAAITLVNVLNPEYLVIAGSLVTDEVDLEGLATTVMSGCLAPTAAGLSAVVVADPDAALIGAASLLAARASRHAEPDPSES